MRTNYLKGMTLALATVAGLTSFNAAAQVSVGDEKTTVTINGTVYNLGENMMANGDLTDGFKGWTTADASTTPYTYTDATDANFKIEAGAGPDETNAIVLIGDGAGSNKPTSLRMPFECTAGKTYYVSFDYKGCSDWTTVYNVPGKDNGANKVDGKEDFAFRCSSGDDWKKAQVIIAVTAENPWIVFNAAWLSKDKSSFANFYIGEATEAGPFDNLMALIDEATSVAFEAAQNTGVFGKSAAAVAALNDAINTACDVADKDGATDDEYTAAITALRAALDTFNASPVTLPKKTDFAADTKMYIKGANLDLWYGLNWTDKARLLYLNGAADPSQQFTFTTPEGAAEGQYNIIDGKGNVVFKDGDWDLSWKAAEGATLTDPNYLFTIVTEDGKTYISNVDNGKVNASDGNWAWAPIYADKAKDNVNAPVEFYSLEADETEPAVNLAQLNAQIKTAEDLLAAAVAGTEPGQYPQEAIDALKKAVEDAKTVATKEGVTQLEADQALVALIGAVETFNNAKNKPATGDLEQADEFLEDNYYYIRNEWSGLWFTAADDEKKSLALGELKEGQRNQQFKFMYVKNADGNNLITSDNRIIKQESWNLNWATYVSGDDYNTAPYLYQVEREGNIYYIKSVGKLGYLAPDDNKAGSSIFSDKAVNFEDENGVAKVPVTLWIAAGAEDAVEGIAAEAAEAEYYNLNGYRVSADSLVKGIYVKRQGSKVTKIMVK